MDKPKRKARNPNDRFKFSKAQRMAVLAELLCKGYSLRRAAAEIQVRLGLEKAPTYSMVQKEASDMLREWHKTQIKETALKVQLELEQIDYQIEQLWEQWEKSKTDQEVRTQRQKNEVAISKESGEEIMVPSEMVKSIKKEVWLGDVRYLVEIRNLQVERRKLLGLYAPEEKQIVNIDVPLTEEDLRRYDSLFDRRYKKSTYEKSE